MNTMIPRAVAFSLAALSLLGPSSSVLAADDTAMVKEAQQVIANFKQTDPGIDRFLTSSPGYVVFPSVGKGGLIVGGAHGTGVLFENGKATGKAALNQVTVGAQAGGQSYSEIIFFQTPAAINDFRQGKFELAAQMSAVAIRAGASANANYTNGVAVFTQAKGGLMAEAAVGGQKFSYTPFK